LLADCISDALSESEVLKLQTLSSVGRNRNRLEGFVGNNRDVLSGSINRALGASRGSPGSITGWPAVIPGKRTTLTRNGPTVSFLIGAIIR
jgi:hypothetical protein